MSNPPCVADIVQPLAVDDWVSEPGRHQDTSRRQARRYLLANSVRLDACEPHHLAPLLGFLGHQPTEVSGRNRKHRAAEVSEPRFHVGENSLALILSKKSPLGIW